MEIILGGPPHIKPVPRSVDTPWLSSRANKWELLQDWMVMVDGKKYIVPEGYITDGASIPRWLWFLFPPSYTPAFRAAIAHDYFYSNWYKFVTKKWADEVFYNIMLYDNADPRVAKLFHLAVTYGGKGGWKQ